MAISGTSGNDKLKGTSGNDVVNGRLGNDTLLGFRGNDLLKGGPGDDLLRGGAGADTLRGGSGADTLQGGTGNDELFGEDGNDILTGGKGDDTLRGGDGADTFIFGNKFGNDTILDFSEGDRLVFSQDFLNNVFGGRGLQNNGFDGYLVEDCTSCDLENNVSGGFGSSFTENPEVFGEDLNRLASELKFGIGTDYTEDDGDAIFDFGNGNTITLQGLASEISPEDLFV